MERVRVVVIGGGATGTGILRDLAMRGIPALLVEKGDLAAYAACYDTNAVQGNRSGASAIRSHKAALWKRSRPGQVVLTNVRITSKQNMIVADMHQAYTDSNSFADMGVKTLHLQVKDNALRIVREEWSPMQQ